MVKVEHEEEVIDVLVDEKQESSNDTTLSPMENLIAENSCINNSNKTESIGLEKRKVDEIDLTISDSDDEPLIWYKRRGSWNKSEWFW